MDFLPKPGDKLEVQVPFLVPGHRSYLAGDVLELIEPTAMAPHGYKSRICNWLVKCKNHPKGSVWSTIWYLLDTGMVTKM